MAIRLRQGLKKDMDANKFLPGEFGVPLDSEEVYVCFAPGNTQRLATHEAMKDQIVDATEDVVTELTADFTANVNAATSAANTAASTASSAASSATRAATNANNATGTATTAAQRANGAAIEAEQFTGRKKDVDLSGIRYIRDWLKRNLLTNTEYANGTITGWSFNNSSYPVSAVAGTGVDGAYALHITSQAANTNNGVQQTKTITAGQKYTFSCWVKMVAGVGEGTLIRVGTLVAESRLIPENGKLGQWQFLTKTFIAPTTVSANVYTVGNYSTYGGVEMYVCNVKLEDGDYTPWSSGVSNTFMECRVFANNVNIALGKIPTSSTPPVAGSLSTYTDNSITNGFNINNPDWQWVQLDLGQRTDIDSIKLWHYNNSSVRFTHKLEVSRDGTDWFTLYDSTKQGAYLESVAGRGHVVNDTAIQSSFFLGSYTSGDFDLIVTPGTAFINATNLTNQPIALPGMLTNTRSGEESYITQEFRTVSATAGDRSRVFKRIKGGAWDELVAPRQGTLTTAGDANNLTTPGTLNVQVGTTANLPFSLAGLMQVGAYSMTGAVAQTYASLDVNPRIGMRVTGRNWAELYTTANKTEITKLVYPIGSIYMSINAANPQAIFGGTWVAWGTGRVAVAVDTSQAEFNTVEKAGGAKTTTHSHQTQFSYDGAHFYAQDNRGGESGGGVVTANRGMFTPTGTGIGSARQDSTYDRTVSNLQPYITCYMWKRTA